jgi:putative peptidoglycan binding protein/glycosyl hydrolase family 19 (putative chitinase)
MLGYYLKMGDVDTAVGALKKCMNASHALLAPLADGPKYDTATYSAVIRFQQLAGLTADGVAGPRTWALLGRKLGYSSFSTFSLYGLPIWARNLLLNDPASVTPSGIHIPLALELYEKLFHTLNPSAHRGLLFLLEKLRDDADVSDMRWAAYMLATVKHECDDEWQPIEERESSWSTRFYGKEITVKDSAGNPYTNRYYGRGYVQLTTEENYALMSREMGLGDELVLHPEKVKDPALAYRILSYGMRNGSFDHVKHVKLGQWIQGSSCDYVAARATVNTNGDQAERIARYARDLEIVLCGAVTNVLGVVLGAATSAFTW